jgi:hypothetical protein
MTLPDELRQRAVGYRVSGPSAEHTADLLDRAAFEIDRLRIENIQLKFACGYPMPAELERHIVPNNPYKCGMCDARRRAEPEPSP